MDRIRQFGESAFASLSVPNYRLYFIGQAVSLSGTWMQTVALGWLALELTGSGAQLGLIVALQFIPMLILGPWGGLVADRLDKRHILYATQVAFMAISVVLSALIWFDLVAVWMMYATALLLGIVRLFDNPTRQAFVSELVDPDNLKNAISLNATVNNLARAIGPMFGGVIIAATGLAFCFLFNAATNLFVMYKLSQLDMKEMNSSRPLRKKGGQILDGLRYVRTTPLIRDLLIMVAIMGTFAYEFQISFAVFAQQTFGAGASGYAALMAGFGAGAALGGTIAASRKSSGTHGFIVFAYLFGFSMIATAFAPTLSLAVVGAVCVGFFSINMLTLANSMIQLESHPDMRGRVMALWGMAVMGTTPIGGPIIGWIAEVFGARVAIGVGGITTFAAVLYGTYVFSKHHRFGRRHKESTMR